MKKFNGFANKGEWSEFYAFLKILEQKKLSAANQDLEITDEGSFVFCKIIRVEDGLTKIYDISNPLSDIVITDQNGVVLKQISSDGLKLKTLKIFEKIKNGKVVEGKRGAFRIEEAEEMMQEFLCLSVKAGNGKKSDIVAIIQDRIKEAEPQLGFSVKSMIGGSSTLFNASQDTNFIFKVTGFSGDIKKVNSIKTKSKIRDRLSKIISSGGQLSFVSVAGEKFDTNLRNIDSSFPKIMAQMLMEFFLGKGSLLSDLVKILAENEVLKKEFGSSVLGYEIKMKRFLDAAALGMVSNTEWNGLSEAQGGYIVVKDNGEVVCYHLYNRDKFSSYLYKNTKLETASSTRHKFGVLYENGGELFFNLNLQVRFVK